MNNEKYHYFKKLKYKFYNLDMTIVLSIVLIQKANSFLDFESQIFLKE